MSAAEAEILVIKLSALGDFIQAFGAFARIRAAHPRARITLLTTPPYEALAASSPYFDAVETDGRPADLPGALALIARLRRRRLARVYDLQGNDRTNLLFQALRPLPPGRPPEWSGVAFGCALPHANPARMKMHTLERHAQQLAAAGIWPDAPTAPGAAPAPDVGWVLELPRRLPPEALAEPRPAAVLVPGAAPRRPAKRWGAEGYGAVARGLTDRGFAVQLVGGPGEAEIGAVVEAAAPGIANLIGRTDLPGLAALGARAALAVGNDTGPLHLLAAAGAPSVALFSADSDPALCAPRGRVTVLRRADLAELDAETVLEAALAQAARGRAAGGG